MYIVTGNKPYLGFFILVWNKAENLPFNVERIQKMVRN